MLGLLPSNPEPGETQEAFEARRDAYLAASQARFAERVAAGSFGGQAKASPSIRAKPFAWIDPASIPRRQWLYGTHYARRFVSTTLAPGGVGKSSLIIVEALALASGRSLLGIPPTERASVWLWNGEDPLEELQRRIMAAALFYDVSAGEFEGRLYVNSGREDEIVIASQARNNIAIAVPIVDAVKATIRRNQIDVMVVDPFVSSHRVSENDNNAIDAVAKTWAKIADECGCAIELVHHVRKTNGAEVTVEDGRGASSLLAAARSARVLNPMTQEEAEKAGVNCRRLHFRVDNGKANMAPPSDHSTWYKMTPHSLPNGTGGMIDDGDSVGVCASWEWPDPLDGLSVTDLRAAQAAVRAGKWRADVRAKDWVGYAIGEALKLDVRNKKPDRARVRQALQIWTANGMFVVVTRKDAHREEKDFVEVGEFADD